MQQFVAIESKCTRLSSFLSIYSLSGDNNELGSTQNPTNAWKNSRTSGIGCSRTIDLRNRENCFELARCNFTRMVCAWDRQKSACCPRIPSEQLWGQPRCLSTLITQFIRRLWDEALDSETSCRYSCSFSGDSFFFPASALSTAVADSVKWWKRKERLERFSWNNLG